MKHLLFVTIATVIILQTSAQRNEGSATGDNMIKLNVTGLFAKSIGVQYERKISQRWSAALSVSAIPKSSLAFQSLFNDFDGTETIDIGNFKLGNFVITPEFRYYVGKHGALRGFYLAPYLRYSSYNIDGPVDFRTGVNSSRQAVFIGKANSISAGLMIGSQFKLSEQLYLDWWIIGASIGAANGTFDAQIALSQNEQASLRYELENLKIPSTTLTSQVNANGAKVETKGTVIGARGLGINLAFRFN